MKALVIGKGGREHALVRALASSLEVDEVHAIPGNDGMVDQAICKAISTSDFSKIHEYIKHNNINLVVVGPEAELAMGLSDYLRAEGVSVFAPSQKAALLESSKVYSKDFMVKAGVPTAKSVTVSSFEETLEKAKSFESPYVLKADGLAAGKGVYICQSIDELEKAAQELFNDKKLGEAGKTALLEEFQEGYELSYLILTNGSEFSPLPFSQDHKRLLEGDKGPNTGGMGVVAPLKIEEALRQEIDDKIVTPTLKQMKEEGLLYRGILYIGVMVTKGGPSVLEYNVRFGDPEAQVVLPLLDGDWGVIFNQVAQGECPNLSWKPLSASCVVVASEGYPEAPVKGVEISGAIKEQSASSYFLHAGTKNENGKWLTNGGRVLNAIGVGSTIQESLANAYEQAQKVEWPGRQIRKDIGHQFLSKN